LLAELEARVDQLKASETDLKNIVYRETDAREVLEMSTKSRVMSASITWSFVKPQTVTLSIAINLCRSSTKIARNCEAS
jgi:hypothetical protein